VEVQVLSSAYRLWGNRWFPFSRRSKQAEVTPASGDDEKHAADRERQACYDRPRGRELELGDLRRRKPDTREQEKQKPDFGEAYARVMCETEHEAHADHSSHPAASLSRRDDSDSAALSI
jgi:hypothetical protein